jgi:hypothetical protein
MGIPYCGMVGAFAVGLLTWMFIVPAVLYGIEEVAFV